MPSKHAYPQEIIPPGEPSHAEKLANIERLADLMDSRFRIPGTHRSFGLDPVIGLLPGIGDTITVAISLYIVKVAHELGAPHHLKARMGVNIFLDWLIGLPPLIGDIFDIGWQANRRNIVLLKKHLEKNPLF